ncbi:hypothetical protein PVK06_025686 [Gossypium arboreum]|uniref:Uncharacterized protein n=1 Tax=Gossypium arboreum TaxID=29729 RepID=A0ABR0NWP3_GOSAR|nr:hypothetical protein PVK06_025686 [Gossypium arboreum]
MGKKNIKQRYTESYDVQMQNKKKASLCIIDNKKFILKQKEQCGRFCVSRSDWKILPPDRGPHRCLYHRFHVIIDRKHGFSRLRKRTRRISQRCKQWDWCCPFFDNSGVGLHLTELKRCRGMLLKPGGGRFRLIGFVNVDNLFLK